MSWKSELQFRGPHKCTTEWIPWHEDPRTPHRFVLILLPLVPMKCQSNALPDNETYQIITLGFAVRREQAFDGIQLALKPAIPKTSVVQTINIGIINSTNLIYVAVVNCCKWELDVDEEYGWGADGLVCTLEWIWITLDAIKVMLVARILPKHKQPKTTKYK